MRVRALDLAKEKGERDEFTRGHAASGRSLAPEPPRAQWMGPEQGRNFEEKKFE